MTLNTNLTKNIFMKSDQDLIFESYFNNRVERDDIDPTNEDNQSLAAAKNPSSTCFDRLEQLSRAKPELQDIITPILLDLEDAMMEIDKLDPNGATGTVPSQALFNQLNQIYSF